MTTQTETDRSELGAGRIYALYMDTLHDSTCGTEHAKALSGLIAAEVEKLRSGVQNVIDSTVDHPNNGWRQKLQAVLDDH